MSRICRRQNGQRRREGGKRLKQGESGENILKQIFSTFSCGKESIEKAGIGRKWEVQIATLVHIMYMTRTTNVIIARQIWTRTMRCA